jgi:hypothetical protein
MPPLRFLGSGILWAASVAVDGAGLRLLHGDPDPGWGRILPFGILHGAAAVMVMGAVSRAREEAFLHAGLEGLLALAVPVLGPVAAGLILLLGTVTRRFWKVPEKELREHLRSPGGAPRDGAYRVLEPQSRSISLGELLRCQDLETVEEALVDLARGSSEAEVDVLKTLLNHSLPEVRLRAHLLMVEMQDRAIGLLAKASEEALPGLAEPRKRAGRACLLLSRIAGDPETFGVFVREAADWLLQAHRADPRDSELLLDLGRSSLLVGTPDDARRYFQDFIERNPGDLRGYLGHAECCFLLGDGASLEPDCDRILEQAPPSSPERTTAEFLKSRVAGGTP